MHNRSEFKGTDVLLVFVVLLVLGLLSSVASAATNLPPVCPNASAEGQTIGSCPYTVQRFDLAGADSLVRSCASVDCDPLTRRWKRFSNVTPTEFVEVCTVDKAVGEIIGGGTCQGEGFLNTWGAMAMVAPAQVAQAGEPESIELSGTFDVTPTEGISPLDVTVTWSVPDADSCEASGAWSGERAASGTEIVTLTDDATLTLNCAGTIEGSGQITSADLSWTPPTQNTDGSALTDLAGYRVFYGASPSVLVQTIQLDNPGLVAYTVENLTPGTWYFAIRAFNEDGIESALSNVASKTIGEGTANQQGTFFATRAVDVSKQPQAPVLTVLEPVAGITQVPVFAVTSSGNRSTAIAGFVAAGTACIGERVFGYRGFGYHLVPREAVTWWDTEPKDVAAPCFDARQKQ